jgi:hypothetical protein
MYRVRFHPASQPVGGFAGSFPGIKSVHSLPHSVEVKNGIECSTVWCSIEAVMQFHLYISLKTYHYTVREYFNTTVRILHFKNNYALFRQMFLYLRGAALCINADSILLQLEYRFVRIFSLMCTQRQNS